MYFIRRGDTEVSIVVDDHGVDIRHGRDAISATIHLDHGEARELAEVILNKLKDLHQSD